MNRTLFRGVTAGVMSGAILCAAAVAGTTLADGAPAASATDVAMPAPTPVALTKRMWPDRPPRAHHRKTHHAASRSAARTALTGSPQMIAHAMLLRRGWSESQWGCLDQLWTRESNWRIYAANSSGAYGIPQALPGSKMSMMGSDWRTNPITQISWGLWYIGNKYGSPCNALAHSNAYNYY